MTLVITATFKLIVEMNRHPICRRSVEINPRPTCYRARAVKLFVPLVLRKAKGDNGVDEMEQESPQYRESHLRSFLKALSWRVLATTTTAVIAWFITGDISTAIAIGSIEFIAKFFIYYGHERVWQLVPRGTIRRIVHPEEKLT